MFGGKNIFLEKTDNYENRNDCAEQTQQNYTYTHIVGEQLIQKQIFWNNEQNKN